ncbi:hypothetical protein ACEWEU_16935, partial [Klebsiella pneumoniae]|uniref:hypothetical protein n=1 Tax=Klebsiella pneumoniae TaxID=573 RepID=UPI001FA9A4CE
ADRNRSHWSTSKTPSYTKSVSWQHHPIIAEQKPRNKVADPARSIFPIRAVILNHKARYYKPIPG